MLEMRFAAWSKWRRGRSRHFPPSPTPLGALDIELVILSGLPHTHPHGCTDENKEFADVRSFFSLKEMLMNLYIFTSFGHASGFAA